MRYVVIPAFNEEKTVATVIRSVLPYADKVLVVDDCSKDSTSQISQEAGSLVVRNKYNVGYERTVCTGLDYALNDGASAVLTMDADGQHPVKMIPKMFSLILEEDFDVAVGCRKDLPRMAERIFSSYTNYRYGITDILSGYKCYSRNILGLSGIRAPWNSVGSFISICAATRGYRVATIDIPVIDRDDVSRFGSNLKQELIILNAMLRALGQK